MFTIGMAPGRVYTQTEIVKGRGPVKGTRGTSTGTTATANMTRVGDLREYVMVQVGAALNLVNGNVIQITGDFNATLPGSAAAAVPNVGPIGVIIASITASASTFVWAQVRGLCSVLFEATTSALPGAAVKLGGTSGQITAAAVTTASSYISGMTVAATVSAVGLGSVMLDYPKIIGA